MIIWKIKSNQYSHIHKFLWAIFFYIYHKIKCGTLSMITFTGGVTLGTFNKEKIMKWKNSKNDTCQFLPIDSHFQYKIIDSYDK